MKQIVVALAVRAEDSGMRLTEWSRYYARTGVKSLSSINKCSLILGSAGTCSPLNLETVESMISFFLPLGSHLAFCDGTSRNTAIGCKPVHLSINSTSEQELKKSCRSHHFDFSERFVYRIL